MNVLGNPPAPVTARPAAPNATPLTAPDFNPLARVYRWLEYLTFGPLLWRCRIRFLSQLGDCRRALVLGDGDGRFTARLLRDNRLIHLHAVDGSPHMIAALQRAALPDQSRLSTEVADLRNWNPAPSTPYDLVVSHFFLDCLTTDQVASLTRRLIPAMRRNSLWVISEFATPDTVYGRAIALPLVALLYRVFHLLTGLEPQTLPDYAPALAQSGWILEHEDRRLWGLLISQLWRLQPDTSASPQHSDSSMKR